MDVWRDAALSDDFVDGVVERERGVEHSEEGEECSRLMSRFALILSPEVVKVSDAEYPASLACWSASISTPSIFVAQNLKLKTTQPIVN